MPALDVEAIRREFPLLSGRPTPLAYLDNAATTQKPRVVLDAERRFYEEECANIHRGVYKLAAQATKAYEGARRAVQKLIGAPSDKEIIFVRGTTEALNLVAQTHGRKNLGVGDEILITGLEHHSNIVPWQMLCEQVGAKLVVVPMRDDGSILIDDFRARLSARTKIAAFTHISNALGTINPVEDMVSLARGVGAVTVIDGAQAVPHLPVDVRALGCDFYAFSAHKMYGPTGIGVLWGRAALLEAMPPYQGGGDMIASVTFEKTTYAPIPAKFEAGTPHIAGAYGLAAAATFLEGLDRRRIAAYEGELLAEATAALSAVPGLRILGTAKPKAAVISFVMDGVHPHDIGTVLDSVGVAVRTGHHCAQPLMDRLGVPATARASFSFYNTRADLEMLVRGLDKVREVFSL